MPPIHVKIGSKIIGVMGGRSLTFTLLLPRPKGRGYFLYIEFGVGDREINGETIFEFL